MKQKIWFINGVVMAILMIVFALFFYALKERAVHLDLQRGNDFRIDIKRNWQETLDAFERTAELIQHHSLVVDMLISASMGLEPEAAALNTLLQSMQQEDASLSFFSKDKVLIYHYGLQDKHLQTLADTELLNHSHLHLVEGHLYMQKSMQIRVDHQLLGYLSFARPIDEAWLAHTVADKASHYVLQLGEQTILGAAPQGKVSWLNGALVLGHIDEHELRVHLWFELKNSQNLKQWFVYLFIGFCLSLFGWYVLFSHFVARPIQYLGQMSEGVQRLDKGEVYQLIDAQREDELGSLEQAFLRMSQGVAKKLYDLEQEQQKVQTIINHMPIPIWLEDDTGKVIQQNKASKVLSSLTAAPLTAFSSTSDALVVPQLLDAHEKKTMHHKNVLCPDGETRHYDVISLVLAEGDAPLSLYMAIDQQQAKTADQASMQNHDEQLQSLQLLASGVAHNVNNILSSINGHVLQINFDQPEASYKRLSAIDQACFRAAEICQQLLGSSSGALAEPKPVVLAALLPEVQSIVQGLVSEHIHISFTVQSQGSSILGRAALLHQVFMNLMKNAAEAMPEGRGQIDVQLSDVCLDTENADHAVFLSVLPEGDYRCVSIADTGCGMSAETQKALFDPHFTTKKEGHGLGMSSILGIVLMHKGYLFLKSEEGSGSTFRLFFPAYQDEDEVLATQSVSSSDERTEKQPIQFCDKRILLVDDEEILCEMACFLLEDAGYQVEVAHSGDEALAYLSDHADDIALVLLDYTMPKMNGDQCFQKILALEHAIPVVMCSGLCHAELKERLSDRFELLAGILSKPYRAKELLGLLETLVGVSRQSSVGSRQ